LCETLRHLGRDAEAYAAFHKAVWNQACGLPGLVPDGFVKGCVGFGVATEVAQGLTEIVVRFAIVGIGVAQGQSFDGATEARFGFGPLTAVEMPSPECVVATGVAWIAPQRLAPVGGGRSRGVTILIEVKTR